MSKRILLVIALIAGCRVDVTAAEKSNGISVGEPKVYDRRNLQQLLQILQQRLAETKGIDPATIKAGQITGLTQNSTSLAFSVSTRPTPGVERTTTSEATSEATTGASPGSKETGKTTETLKQSSAAQAPSVPVPAAPSGLTVSANFIGLNGEDLLQQQVNLEYQIINLQLLLEGAVSDRYKNGTRFIPAVLGMAIDVQPEKAHENAVAEIDIQVMTAESAKTDYLINYRQTDKKPARQEAPKDFSVYLMSMFPREKTYNVAALTEKSLGFNTGVLVGAFNLGGGFLRASKKLYLMKDIDTIARALRSECAENKCGARFGWQFRPVLGRPAVSPGNRDVFAVVAVPSNDQDEQAPWKGTVRICTRWREYDVKRGLLGKPIGEDCTTKDAQIEYPLEVLPPGRIHAELAPEIDPAMVEPGSNGTFLVSVNGAKFGADVKVQVGDREFVPGHGLVVDSENHLRFLVPATALASSSAYLVGRYGEMVEIRVNPKDKEALKCDIKVEPVTAKKVLVTLKTNLELGPSKLLLARVGPQVFSSADGSLWKSGDKEYQFSIAADELRNSPEVIVRVPLHGPNYVTRLRPDLSGDFAADAPVLLSSSPKGNRYGITGIGLSNACIRLAGGMTVPVTEYPGTKLIEFTLTKEQVEQNKLIVLERDGTNLSLILKLPPQPPPVAKITAQKTPLYAGDNKEVTLEGTSLQLIVSAEFNGRPLRISPDSSPTALIFEASRELTETSGEKIVRFVNASGELVAFNVFVQKRKES